MPPTRQEAELERREALEDLREDGAPATLRYDENWQATGRQRPPPSYVDVPVHVLRLRFEQGAVSDGPVVAGDSLFMLADADLDQLAALAELPLGGEPGATGYSLVLGKDPEGHPDPDDDGAREFKVLRLMDTTFVGGWKVLHELHTRG